MKDRADRTYNYIDMFLLLGMTAFLMIYFDVRYLFSDTVVTGGDTASWHGVADHLMKVLIPSGRLTGWDMGNFCGYPNFNFYFLPPFLLAVVPSTLFGIPLTIALKWAIMSGVFLLPAAAYWCLRNMEYRFPVPIMGATGAMLLMFNESYTMFGANTLSTFAGEFCYMSAFALFVYFIGSFYRGYKSESRVLVNGILLGLIGLSHLFVFIPALFLLVYAFFDSGRVRYLLGVGLNGFAIMAFWILPLMAFRHPYTTPVYMIWQEFVNWRYFVAGAIIIFISIAPRMALGVIGRGKDKTSAWGWGFAAFCAAGLGAVTYLAAQYLVLGSDIWTTGLNLPDHSASPLGKTLAEKIRPLILPASVLSGLVTGVFAVMARRKGKAALTAFCRVIGSLGMLLIAVSFVLALHIFVVNALGLGPLRGFLLRRSLWVGVYGISFLISGFFLIFSRRLKGQLEQTARREAQNTSRFLVWPVLIFGCVVAYFSAHFLQVPDIRFLPPLIFALGFIICAETLGVFVIEKRQTVKIAAAITAVYLAIVLIIFGAERSDRWFRSNNRGYQMAVGFQDFFRANQHLKTAYLKKGLNPLNAPRVAYEKCNLYGPYGGDRVFESLPFFSGRQTLEGIHFAGSMASRSMAYLQTEFSRDIKTPKPQILSKINIDALPAHFDLYNISQLIVMTSTVKKALSSSQWFEREAVFGDINLYRYAGSDQRYVDVPKIRPVLYTGKNWADDFYTWFQDPDRVDVLLVPDRFVGNAEDRSVFSGKTDSFIALETFRKNRLDRAQLKIDTRLDHLKIRFTTNKIGLPHLVKVSYFPNWRVKGARGVYPVSPHLMMVIPREKEVVLTYAKSSWEILGLAITTGWIVLILGTAIYKYAFLTRKEQNRAGRNKIRIGLERGWETLERILVRYRRLILCLVLVTALGLTVAGAVLRNRPVRIYTAGFQTYKKGVRLLQEGKSPEAKKYLRRAITIMEPLIDGRASHDHRDVINSLLVAAMCHEKLTDYRSAEKRYQTLINEYPRSRYVGEGYVKLARIYKWQAASLWRQGLNLSRLGEKKKGAEILRQGLALMERSLDFYARVSEKEPYSNWVRYALDDLKKEKQYLKNTLKEIMVIGPDAALKARLEKLLDRVKAKFRY